MPRFINGIPKNLL